MLVMCRVLAHLPMAPKKGKTKGSGSRNRRVLENSHRNGLYTHRLENIRNRTIHPDRSIDLNDVGGTDIVRQVEGMGWRQFVTKPRERANVSIVREFYAGMIPSEFLEGRSVKVRDVDVFVRPDDINRYYGTISHEDLPTGFPKMHIFRLYDSTLAASLRREIEHSGLWDKHHHLRQSELERDLAFWAVFVSHSLKPTQQRTHTVLDLAQILYCIKHGLQIDVGRLIRLAIGRAGKTERAVIPFPCLISDLCREAGVPERRGDDLLMMGDPCNSRTFRDLTAPQDVERLLPLGSRKRQRFLHQQEGRGADSGDEHAEEDPGAVPDMEERPEWFDDWVQEQDQQRPAWFDSWIQEQAQQRPPWFDSWSQAYSQQTPAWATSMIQTQRDQGAQIDELIRVLQASTLTASEPAGGAGPSRVPQDQDQQGDHDDHAH